MNRFTAVLILCLFSGCGGAGVTYDVLTYDNVIGAALEAKKGVEAFNVAIQTDGQARQEHMLQALGAGVKMLAQDQALDAAAAEKLAQSVMDSLRGHLANYAEQERRRAQLYEITIDNLNYIIQISEQGKKFSIYRADIGVQWKSYLEASVRKAIGSID